jgi:hypothetical protein
MSNLTLKDVLEMNSTKELFIQYGRFCEYYEIVDADYIGNYELFLSCGNIEWNIDKQNFNSIKENQLYNFFRRLKTEDYRAILLNDKEVLTNDDKFTKYYYKSLIERLDDVSIVLGCDSLKVIHINGEINILKGYEEMSYFEIFTRQFLMNECGEDFGLVVKYDVWQDEFDESQIKDVNDYYEKCKDIKFAEFIEENKSMNGNTISIHYKDDKTEIWQPL